MIFFIFLKLFLKSAYQNYLKIKKNIFNKYFFKKIFLTNIFLKKYDYNRFPKPDWLIKISSTLPYTITP
jgi:hypothetical protein